MRKVAARKNGRCRKGSRHVKGKPGCWAPSGKKGGKKKRRK